MLHAIITTWFNWVHDWGYWGVFILMAMESTILPVPSEIVMPPAAFWAAQGRMNFWGVVAAGTFGSYFGSLLSYLVCLKWGRGLLNKYGKYFFLSEQKLNATEVVFKNYGAAGVFTSRLLPVVRHLISFIAGALNMNFATFSFVTLTGAGIWCYLLSLWGQQILGEHPELLNSPAEMVHVMKSEMLGFVSAVLIFFVLYLFVVWFQRRLKVRRQTNSNNV